MDNYEALADYVMINRIRGGWLEISKMFNEIAAQFDGTLSMAFVLLTLDNKEGTPVTKIAPRMGMEPNSLSRVLRSMETKGAIFRRRDKTDKRKVYICLTDYGKEMRKVAFARVNDFEAALREKLSPEQIQSFFEVMNVIPGVVQDFRDSHLAEPE